jgi:DNA-directed RNA polymerase subunit K
MSSSSATTQILSYQDIADNYDPSKNTTRAIMNKYEKAKVLGVRIQQLASGGSTLIEGLNNPRDIAVAELEQGKLPFVIVRTLPNGIKEYWKVKDMTILPS